MCSGLFLVGFFYIMDVGMCCCLNSVYVMVLRVWFWVCGVVVWNVMMNGWFVVCMMVCVILNEWVWMWSIVLMYMVVCILGLVSC